MSRGRSEAASARRMANMRRGVLARGATLIVPALLSILALAGVTIQPALGVSRARALLRAAEARDAEHRAEQERWNAFETARAIHVARAGRERVRALVPRECTSVVAHGVVRAVAARAGLDVETLQIGDDVDLGLEELSDRIVAREATIGGRGSLLQVLLALDELRALGFPTCVLEAWFERSDPLEARYQFRIVIGLMHYAPGSASEAATAEGTGA
jgi:hypothetical protein